MLQFLLTKFRKLRIVRALRIYKELEDFAVRHQKVLESPQESLLYFYQRKAYRAGQEDGEQHVLTHAYYWAGGQDEDWEPNLKELHQTLCALNERAQKRLHLLAKALKRDIRHGEQAARY